MSIVFRVLLAAFALVIALAGAGGWWFWQFNRNISLYTELSDRAEADDPIQPTQAQLAAIRKLHFSWNVNVESGGPVVDPRAQYGSADIADDLAPLVGSRDRMAIAQFHFDVARALAWSLEHGELPPGRYPLAFLENATIEREWMSNTQNLSARQIEETRNEIPWLKEDGFFDFTEAHRKLLAHLRFGWPTHAAPEIHSNWRGQVAFVVNFKRPFGDMTAFNIDMARILDWPRPQGADFDPELWRLYGDMWPALQTFVEHAKIPVRSR